MKRVMVAVLASMAISGCLSRSGSIVDNVMMDFGLKEKPEGYVSGSDRVFEKLGAVSESELKRLNLAEQHGRVKFQQQSDMKGKYYREVRVYENAFPTDAQASARTQDGDRGYCGYIEFEYRLYQSERKDTAADAEAARADIPTDETGRETYRYGFSAGGDWDGRPGQKTKK